jgi:uncharacterized membrane protein
MTTAASDDGLQSRESEASPPPGGDATDSGDAISPGRTTFDQALLPWIEGFVRFVSRHWLALMNAAVFIFAGLPVLAPLLEASGNPALVLLGQAIFFAYRATCHQMPSRSFFIAGHQMAWCERDAAIWMSFLLWGLLFSLVRRRLKPMSVRWYAVFILPMAIDGTTQLFGFRESTWELRVITGTLFALATAWLILPILERGMREVRESLEGDGLAPEAGSARVGP